MKDPDLESHNDGDLKDLPFAKVITAEIDPLMSEGKMLAEKLKAAGVETNYLNNEGVTRGPRACHRQEPKLSPVRLILAAKSSAGMNASFSRQDG